MAYERPRDAHPSVHIRPGPDAVGPAHDLCNRGAPEPILVVAAFLPRALLACGYQRNKYVYLRISLRLEFGLGAWARRVVLSLNTTKFTYLSG